MFTKKSLKSCIKYVIMIVNNFRHSSETENLPKCGRDLIGLAEKYGVIPPKFTKAWWEYFWDYYKWYVIGGGFVLLLVVVTAVQCATQKRYDMTVTYAGNAYFSEEQQTHLEDAMANFVQDVDGNGEQAVFFQNLTISGQKGQEQFDYAMQTKLELEFQNDCSFIFLFSKEQLDSMLSRDYVADLYVPVSEWAPDLSSDFETVSAQDGVAYAVNLENSSFFKNLGINSKDLYVAIRYQAKDDEKNQAAYESSLNLLKEFTK